MSPMLIRSRMVRRISRTAAVLALCLAVPAAAQDARDLIRLNQIGFYPGGPKAAVVVDAPEGDFLVRALPSRDTIHTGQLGAAATWAASGETVRVAAFSEMEEAGRYEILVPGVGTSHPFEIRGHVHEHLARASLKAFYFQRASMALHPAFAGVYARPAGHPDDNVRVHASAATEQRPPDTIISAARGWYDAGDYNKYIVNSGITTSTLLSFLEHYPAYASALETNIPESDDDVPDLLDEILWNLRWMLAMQDPHDGGVYHKLTHANFSGAVMPHQATAPRYVVEKSTAATLDFAAVMAQATRVIRDYEDALPDLADSTLAAAEAAWNWARRHPDSYYAQSLLNAFFDPDIHTGEYGDGNVADEFDWAAIEMYITTGQDSFLTATGALANKGFALPGWPNVRALGYYSLLAAGPPPGHEGAIAGIRNRVLGAAGALRSRSQSTPYRATMDTGDFYWGSNSVAANQGVLLLQAFRQTQDSTYLDAAISALDYLLGRNATTYSMVTGHGVKSPMHPHHRPSEADAVAAPVPGLLAGGPNPGRQDNCSYPSTLPARAYVDTWCSYASNEIAINWNAPLFYLAAAVEAHMSATGEPVAAEPSPRVSPSVALDVYPNPASSSATIAFVLPEATTAAVELYDLQGRRVRAREEMMPAGRSVVSIDLHGLARGLYVVRVRAGTTRYAQPLIVAP